MQNLEFDKMILDVSQEIEIEAKPEDVFEGLVHRLTNLISPDSGDILPLRLERWPGGRWFRDLGTESGHLWGFVQSIKPPALLEFYGPMFMSYPVAGHLIFRLESTSRGTKLSFRHRALGLIQEDHRAGVIEGWSHMIDRLKKDCED